MFFSKSLLLRVLLQEEVSTVFIYSSILTRNEQLGFFNLLSVRHICEEELITLIKTQALLHFDKVLFTYVGFFWYFCLLFFVFCDGTLHGFHLRIYQVFSSSKPVIGGYFHLNFQRYLFLFLESQPCQFQNLADGSRTIMAVFEPIQSSNFAAKMLHIGPNTCRFLHLPVMTL